METLKEKYIDMILAKLQGQLDRNWDDIDRSMKQAKDDADPAKKFEFPLGISVKLIPNGSIPKVHTIVSFSRKFKDDDGETPIDTNQVALEFERSDDKAKTKKDDDYIAVEESEPVDDEPAPEIDVEKEVTEKKPEPIEDSEFETQEIKERFEKFIKGENPNPTPRFVENEKSEDDPY